ncbi:MAG: phage/plasmid primase, P4 family [Candidatus Aenigmatarchaeota archaeon]
MVIITKINIPKKLRKEDFRFVKIQKGKKGPFEKRWQKDNNYRYNDAEFQEWDGNYGVVCGFGDLTVIDADNEITEEKVENHLPETFTVETGSGGKHYYFICKDIEKPIRLKQEEYGDLGDVQFKGKQVVGPGSLHPNGSTYSVLKDKKIKEISVVDIKKALKDLIKNSSVDKVKEEEDRKRKKHNIDELNITDVVDTSGLTKRGNEYQGPHPIHGSTTGMNFCVNPSKNVWHCFRKNCDSGGGPLSWIAVKEGIINCSEAQPGGLQGDVFRKVLKIAKDKYGLEINEDKNIENDKTDLPFFTEDGKFVPLWMAENIMNDYHFATHEETEELYVYENGIYKAKGVSVVKSESQKRLKEYVKTHYVNEALEAVKRDNYTPQEKFNNPNDGIVVENGLLKVEERELKDHSPEYVHLTKIPWKYDPEADCPKIKQFISEIVNEGDKKLIQEMFGYCLLKDYPFSKAFMLLGSGANGKSTLLQLLKIFLGEDNIATPSLQDLLQDKFAKIQLFGKLANIHADLSSKKLENTGTFKMLTGGDMMYGQKKFQDPIKFKNHAKLIYSANELPKTDDRTEAFFRRWIVIEFPNQFSGEDADPDLPDSLIDEEEMSGLLNWALDGLERIKEQNGFSQTESREEIEKKWIMKTDSLRAFLDIACETETDAYVVKKDFYELYKKFCSENNVYTVKKGQVTKRLPTLKPQIHLERVGKNNKIGGFGNRPRIWKNLEIKKSFIKENSYVQEVQPLRTSSIVRANNNNNNNNNNNKRVQNTLDLSDLNKNTLLEKIEDFLPNNGKTIDIDVFKDTLELELDVSEDRAEGLIDEMEEKGIIHQPRPGKIKKL